MRGWIGRFVQIDDPITQVLFKSPSKWRSTSGEWSVMRRPDVEFVVILEKERPSGCVKFGSGGGGSNDLGCCCCRFRDSNYGRAVFGLALLLLFCMFV
jgi:hypothetical protein